MPLLLIFAVLLAVALTGCSTPFVEPEVEVAGRFAQADASLDEPEVAWWESYGDAVLSSLIRRAAQQNRDIKMAATRVRAARAGETISRSRMLPNVGVTAAGNYQRTEYDAAAKQEVPDVKSLSGGIDVSWEIDLSGRLRCSPGQCL